MAILSVIVPVYNSKKYISKCIYSILNQTFTDFECIIVDDGSSDGSSEVCDSISNDDDRVKVIHKTNEGVSVARNIGLEIASGEWITFVDSDDWLELNTFEVAIGETKEKDVDVIQWGFTSSEDYFTNSYSIEQVEVNSKTQLPYWFNACWGKLFRISMIKDNNIEFPKKISVGEDRFFSYCCYSCSKKILLINGGFYHYYQNENSVMNSSYSKEKILDDVESMKLLENYLFKKKDSRFNKSIFENKLRIKNMCVAKLSPSDFDLWRSIFPEINIKSLFIPKKSVLLNWMIFFHLDFLVNRIIYIKYKRK